jgi:hypothetical protein
MVEPANHLTTPATVMHELQSNQIVRDTIAPDTTGGGR